MVVAGTLEGDVAAIGERRDLGLLDPDGLPGPLSPDRLVLTVPRDRRDTLWSIETAARSGAAGVVLGVLDRGPDLTESRRIQLAAEAGGCTALLVVARPTGNSAAETRWRCAYRLVETFESSSLACELYKNKRGTSGVTYHVTVARQSGLVRVDPAPGPRSSRASGPSGG